MSSAPTEMEPKRNENEPEEIRIDEETKTPSFKKILINRFIVYALFIALFVASFFTRNLAKKHVEHSLVMNATNQTN